MNTNQSELVAQGHDTNVQFVSGIVAAKYRLSIFIKTTGTVGSVDFFIYCTQGNFPTFTVPFNSIESRVVYFVELTNGGVPGVSAAASGTFDGDFDVEYVLERIDYQKPMAL